jgi:hypothetical protein
MNWPSLSRSYRVNLPSSFNVVISNALVFATCPPVADSGTVRCFFCCFSSPTEHLTIFNTFNKIGTCFDRRQNAKEYPSCHDFSVHLGTVFFCILENLGLSATHNNVFIVTHASIFISEVKNLTLTSKVQ